MRHSSPTSLYSLWLVFALTLFMSACPRPSLSALVINSAEEESSSEVTTKPEPKNSVRPFALDGGDALEDAKADAMDGLDRFNVKSAREGARGESEMVRKIERRSTAAPPSPYLQPYPLPKLLSVPRSAVYGSSYLSASPSQGGKEGLTSFKSLPSETGSVAATQPAMQPPDFGYWGSNGGFNDAQPELPMWAGDFGGYGSNVQEPFPAMQQQQAITMPYTSGYGVASPYTGYLEKQIKSYPIMIYTLSGCEPCQNAKHLLAVYYPDVRAHFLELSGNEAWQMQLQMELMQLTGAMTFPYIFVCGRYIGGSTDLFKLHETGQLRPMVSQCLKANSSA